MLYLVRKVTITMRFECNASVYKVTLKKNPADVASLLEYDVNLLFQIDILTHIFFSIRSIE